MFILRIKCETFPAHDTRRRAAAPSMSLATLTSASSELAILFTNKLPRKVQKQLLFFRLSLYLFIDLVSFIISFTRGSFHRSQLFGRVREK